MTTAKVFLLLSAISGFAFTICKRTTREWTVKALIKAQPSPVFKLHLDPRRFYGVLNFQKNGPTYIVLEQQRSDDGKMMEYLLKHVTPLMVITSKPKRLNIDENTRKFEETFTVLSTNFYFWWYFKPAESGDFTEVNLRVRLSGPIIGVLFFSIAGGGPPVIWKRRFEITNEHLDLLISR